MNSNGHAWSIVPFGVALVVVSGSTSDPVAQDPRFTFRLVTDFSSNIISSLSVVSFAGFNGSLISCAGLGSGGSQETRASVLGKLYTTYSHTLVGI